MGVRDFVERLRPSGTPGAPSVAGVPADTAADRTRELDPVFSALQPTLDAVHRFESQAEQEADRRRQSAARGAEAILAEARANEAGERARAAAAAQAGADEEAAAITAAAEREAAGILDDARARAPKVAQWVRDRARERLLALVEEES